MLVSKSAVVKISKVLDYIVHMSYDLHGQGDRGNGFNQDGCPACNCLRSHVSLTETVYALAMTTRASVPSNKIPVGIQLYGRSFRMMQSGCTGPNCLFVSPDSPATRGDTGTLQSHTGIHEKL